MNPGLDDDHTSIKFYDSDYPAPDGPFAEMNFDETVTAQGLAHDITRFADIAGSSPRCILDLCAGTGRISIPLARQGHHVVAVDISKAMLAGLEKRLQNEPSDVAERVLAVQQDICCLDLTDKHFDFALIGFNSLLCIPDFHLQMKALQAIASHIKKGGLLVIDAINPLTLNISGDTHPKPFFTRINPNTGKQYTRFAMMGPMDAEQCQELSGWYDEYDDDQTVKRYFYSMRWRPIYRYEMELMLKKAGFVIKSIEGGHQKEPFTAISRKMFILAERASCCTN